MHVQEVRMIGVVYCQHKNHHADLGIQVIHKAQHIHQNRKN